MPLQPTTTAALDHVLATAPARRAAAVRRGRAGARRELVWSGAAGTVDGRADGRAGRRRHAVPDGVDHQDLRRGVRAAAARRGPARADRPVRRARARLGARRRQHRAAAHPRRRHPGRDARAVVGAHARRRLGRPRRRAGRAAVPRRAPVPLLQRRVRRAGSPPRGAPRPRLVRRRARRAARAARHDPHDDATVGVGGARAGRAPVRRPAAARAGARRRRDGPGRAAVDHRDRPGPVGDLPRGRDGRRCCRPRRSPRWSSRTTSSTTRASRGSRRTAWASRCGTSAAPGSPVTAARCPASSPGCGCGWMPVCRAATRRSVRRATGWCSSPTPRHPPPRGRPSTSCSTRWPGTSRRRSSRGRRAATRRLLELVGTWHWGPSTVTATVVKEHLVLGEPGSGRGARFRPVGTDEWVGLDSYYAGEPLRVVRRADGSVSHLDLASFRFTRTPYDPRPTCRAASTSAAGPDPRPAGAGSTNRSMLSHPPHSAPSSSTSRSRAAKASGWPA